MKLPEFVDLGVFVAETVEHVLAGQKERAIKIMRE